MKTLSCILLMLIMVSCAKNERLPLSNNVGTLTLIEQLDGVNRSFLCRSQTKAQRQIQGWEIIKAGAISAYNSIMESPDSIVTRITPNDDYNRVLAKTGARTAWTSVKAYFDGQGQVFSNEHPFSQYVLCANYIYTITNAAFNRGGPIIQPDDDNPVMETPTDYTITVDMGLNNNSGLEYLLNEESLNSINVNVIDSLRQYFAIDNSYESIVQAETSQICYDIDYTIYFDENNTSEQILILFAAAYEQGVVTFSDVEALVGAYISVINTSGEISLKEKIALNCALNVICASNLMWNTYLNGTI